MEKEIEGLPEAVQSLAKELSQMNSAELSQILYSLLVTPTDAKISKLKVIKTYLDMALFKEYGI